MSEDSYLDEPCFSVKLEYVYLIRERENVRMNEPIYKIGKTTQSPNSRLTGYPKASEIYLFQYVQNCSNVENEIIRRFDIKFQKRLEIGREYYRGSVLQMIDTINDICKEQLNDQRTDDLIPLTDTTSEYNIKVIISDNTHNSSAVIENINDSHIPTVNIINIHTNLSTPDESVKLFRQHIINTKPGWYIENKWIFIHDLYKKFIDYCDSDISIAQFSKKGMDVLYRKRETRRINGKQGRAVLLKKYTNM